MGELVALSLSLLLGPSTALLAVPHGAVRPAARLNVRKDVRQEL